jgi:DNA-binding protein
MTTSETESNDNVIFVGNKPPMSYVVAVLTEFERSSNVVIKARGKAISKAVETAEIVRKKYNQAVEVIEISIDTEHITDKDTNKPMDIPSIVINLAKPVK